AMLERPKFYREQKQKKEEIMFTDAIGNAGYSLLKDLRAEIEVKDGTFSLCFWVYLANSTTFPATIIQQVCAFFLAFFLSQEWKKFHRFWLWRCAFRIVVCVIGWFFPDMKEG
ncbi:hypothetical protein S83_067257, partial [Arachis hypogaea]